MKSSNRTGRARVLIVDPDFEIGLTLADSLATSGYHPVLVRRLESVINDLGEIRPEAILLGPAPQRDALRSDGVEELRLARQVCPSVPIITIAAPKQKASAPLFAQNGRLGAGRGELARTADVLHRKPDHAAGGQAPQVSLSQ